MDDLQWEELLAEESSGGSDALISSVLCCWVIAIVSVIGSSLFFSLLGLLLVLNVVCLSVLGGVLTGTGFY